MKNKESDCFRIADEVERYHGVLTLLWHPPIFNTLEYPDARDIYIKINQYCQEKGAWIARARDIYEWLLPAEPGIPSPVIMIPQQRPVLLVPDPADQDHFFTLYLPPNTDCIIRSENADIIKRDGDHVYIKTHNLQKNNEIVVRNCMTVEIRIANNADAKEWDTIISESPHGTLFHHWNWLKITEKHTQTKLYPLIGIKNGDPIGVFPLFFQKKGPVRMVFSPPPHAALFYLGPVLTGYDTLRQEKWENMYIDFQNSVENFIKNDLKANYISISLSPALQDPRPFTWSGYTIEPNYDYVSRSYNR